MAMRDQIKEAIEAGGATRDSLLELTGTTEKGLASQFTYMRMMGNCPKKQEDGTYKLVTTEEWEASRGSSSPASNLTPAQRVERAEKRSKRAASAYDSAEKRLEANPDDRLTKLKHIKAEAEFEIAEIELGKAEGALADAPPKLEEVEDDGIPELDEDEDEEFEDEDEDEELE